LALLLNLDTATEVASVSISVDGVSVAYKQNEYQKEHASFVHAAIEEMLEEGGFKLKDMDAFSVTSGPGSYTGLRVGMATAKGFCYAFSKPLLAINTLEVMAKAAIDTVSDKDAVKFLCPMIDARRMEVFTAVYDTELRVIVPPQSMVLDSTAFDSFLEEGKIIFFGCGSVKFKEMKSGSSSLFKSITSNAKNVAHLAERNFNKRIFSDVSYSQPDYFKEFYTQLKPNEQKLHTL
jgi:tRNA threonylcarbamoyladenosine biosynthesis protein TsaB